MMQIYLLRQGQKEGPFTLDQVNRDLVAGKYTDEDYWAWYEGLKEWVPLYQVPGVEQPPATAAPIHQSPPDQSPMEKQGNVALNAPVRIPELLPRSVEDQLGPSSGAARIESPTVINNVDGILIDYVEDGKRRVAFRVQSLAKREGVQEAEALGVTDPCKLALIAGVFARENGVTLMFEFSPTKASKRRLEIGAKGAFDGYLELAGLQNYDGQTDFTYQLQALEIERLKGPKKEKASPEEKKDADLVIQQQSGGGPLTPEVQAARDRFGLAPGEKLLVLRSESRVRSQKVYIEAHDPSNRKDKDTLLNLIKDASLGKADYLVGRMATERLRSVGALDEGKVLLHLARRMDVKKPQGHSLLKRWFGSHSG